MNLEEFSKEYIEPAIAEAVRQDMAMKQCLLCGAYRYCGITIRKTPRKWFDRFLDWLSGCPERCEFVEI